MTVHVLAAAVTVAALATPASAACMPDDRATFAPVRDSGQSTEVRFFEPTR